MQDRTEVLILGGGVTGLAFASFLRDRDCLVLERDSQVGGYCKSILRNGFVWDYSGHFFHFKHPEIKDYVLEHMDCEVVTVNKVANIHYKGTTIDFPFQYNIHQLPTHEFIECLTDLYHCQQASANQTSTFKSFVRSTLGDAICDKFIFPYNEKLYACDLDDLDYDAMGRFFPPAIDFSSLLKHMSAGKPAASYNDTFIYPVNGSFEFIKSIVRRLKPESLVTGVEVTGIDLERKVAHTSAGAIGFERLVSSMPFNRLLAISGGQNSPAPRAVLSANKVVVFNLGFDRGTDIKANWTYFPGPEIFYRVGFYNNIFSAERMSLYVEIGLKSSDPVDEAALLQSVLADLEKCGIVGDHNLIDYQCLVMDPAYVHITESSKQAYAAWAEVNNERGIHSIGRYGSWTYCSIEDNIVQARALALADTI